MQLSLTTPCGIPSRRLLRGCCLVPCSAGSRRAGTGIGTGTRTVIVIVIMIVTATAAGTMTRTGTGTGTGSGTELCRLPRARSSAPPGTAPGQRGEPGPRAAPRILIVASYGDKKAHHEAQEAKTCSCRALGAMSCTSVHASASWLVLPSPFLLTVFSWTLFF